MYVLGEGAAEDNLRESLSTVWSEGSNLHCQARQQVLSLLRLLSSPQWVSKSKENSPCTLPSRSVGMPQEAEGKSHQYCLLEAVPRSVGLAGPQ